MDVKLTTKKIALFSLERDVQSNGKELRVRIMNWAPSLVGRRREMSVEEDVGECPPYGRVGRRVCCFATLTAA